MAKAVLNFKSSKNLPLNLGTWAAFHREVGDSFVDTAKSDKSVYVIRLCRPFCIYYADNRLSPVLYIGRGHFKERISSHLKRWLKEMGKGLKDAEFRVLVSEPKTNNNIEFYKDVEADLIAEFERWAGMKPLNNGKHEKRSKRMHVYSPRELRLAFGLGSGRGYRWAIWPTGSNPLTERSWK